VERPLESVPNFSEGREQAMIQALAAATGERARLAPSSSA
jgi:glutamate formiminotransferase